MKLVNNKEASHLQMLYQIHRCAVLELNFCYLKTSVGRKRMTESGHGIWNMVQQMYITY